MNVLALKFTTARTLLLTPLLLCVAPSSGAQENSWIDLEKQSGAALFDEKCGMCHDGGGMGTGILARRLQGDRALLENRSDLQPAFIATAVRSGIGLMYPLSRGEVSNEQLDKITRHLVKE